MRDRTELKEFFHDSFLQSGLFGFTDELNILLSSYLQGLWDSSLHVSDVFQHAVRHFALVSCLAAESGSLVLQTLHPG